MIVRRSAGRAEPCRFEVLGHRDVGVQVANTILEPFMPRAEGLRQDVPIVARVGSELPPRTSGPSDLGVIDVNRHDKALLRGAIVSKAWRASEALLLGPPESHGMSTLLMPGRRSSCSSYVPSTDRRAVC
jgi:hypothetical protein